MWIIFSIYALSIVLLNIPAIQNYCAIQTSHVLEKKLGTKVHIGRINVGLLNRIIIDDVRIDDQNHRKMLSSHRVSAKLSLLSLFKGEISINSAQIFGLHADITKSSESAPLNCQFIIDSLASKDTTSKKPLILHIGSLIIRNTAISYNRLDLPRIANKLDANHLTITDLSSHIMLYALTDDSLSVRVKRLSFTEKNSGFAVKNFVAEVNKGLTQASLNKMILDTDNSNISIDASVAFRGKKITQWNIKSDHSSIGMKDISLFVPHVRSLNHTFFLDADISGKENSLSVNRLALNNSNKSFILTTRANAISSTDIISSLKTFDNLLWKVSIDQLHADASFISSILTSFNVSTSVLSRIGTVDYAAELSGKNKDIKAKGKLETGVGSIGHEVALDGKHIDSFIELQRINLGRLTDNEKIGIIEANISATADLVGNPNIVDNVVASINAPLIEFNSYPLRNLSIDLKQKGGMASAMIDFADTNLNAVINAKLKNNGLANLISWKTEQLKELNIEAKVKNINPSLLNITNQWESNTFAFNTKVDIENIGNILKGLKAELTNFSMRGAENGYSFNQFVGIINTNRDGTKTLSINSDFANVNAFGRYDINTLSQSLTNIIAKKLPTLPGIPHYAKSKNSITFDGSINNTEILKKLFKVDLDVQHPIVLNGYLNDYTQKANLHIDAPSFSISNAQFTGTRIDFNNPGDTLYLNITSRKENGNGKFIDLKANGTASNNRLKTALKWDNGNGNEFRGSLHAESQFYDNGKGATALIHILPSEVMMGDSLWNVKPGRVVYTANHLEVDNVLIEHEAQHIAINGLGTTRSQDSLTVNLSDVDVAYIMNIVNFHSVDFGGFASGQAVVKGLFGKIDAYANLDVSRFLFENGRLGTLTAHGRWNDELGQIDIKAQCVDNDVVSDVTALNRDERLDINGYISLKKKYIDLDIKAQNARLEFLSNYTSSFLSDIDAWASGRVNIIGPLNGINLTGNATATGSVKVNSLNTTYYIKDIPVTFVPNDILFDNVKITDKFGKNAFISGGLHHRNLSKMTFDLDIKAHNFLCFDFPDLNGSTFGGTVIGDGTCKIKGRSGEVLFDIEADPKSGSEIIYNISSPDALQNQEFITWKSSSPEIAETSAEELQKIAKKGLNTDVRLNILIHATPESTIRLIMDQRTGDNITLHGSGTLRANYYNKGGLQIYGNYVVDHGEYKMTIQQVITKSFEFLPGSSMVFGGDPFECALNLKAQYVVPSVPLSDLNIGNSFSNNNVRVNCLMNISGTGQNPVVDFDLNLPQASTDIQQMITSLIDSEEERNQQVLYLLSIGRFYAANNATAVEGQSQTSLAMQSFLSGTLSQQINNIISDQVLKNRNWNFGANISPGYEGMMNAEYEGIVSGRMLNNRLLLNGQFGYRDNVNATTSFIGDFDVRYLLLPNGNISVRVYNQTSDRYFTKSNLNTQGIGIVLKHDFNSFIPYFLFKKKEYTKKQQ